MVVVFRETVRTVPAALLPEGIALMSLRNWKEVLYCVPQLKVAKSFGLGASVK